MSPSRLNDQKSPGSGIGRIRHILILTVGMPLLILGLIEGSLHLFRVNTEGVRSSTFKIGVPLWAYDEANMSLAGDIYRQILDNELPAESARWLDLFTRDRDVYYKMKPGIDTRVTNTVNRRELEREIRVHMHSSAEGFRTEDIPVEKGPGVFRIACLGDSTTFGWGVNQKERFSHLLQEKLNCLKDPRTFQVLNFGIPGYTSHHGLQVLEHYVLKYAPDLVILSFGANDGRKIPSAIKKMLLQPTLVQRIKGVLSRFKTYRLLRKLLLSLYNPLDRHMDQKDARIAREPFVTPSEYSRNLEEFIDTGRKHGFRTILLGLCCPLDYMAKMSAVGRREGVLAVDGMHLLLGQLKAIEEGTAFQNEADWYRDLYGAEILRKRRILYVTSDSCHPNIIGHRILAGFLLEKLVDNGYLTPED